MTHQEMNKILSVCDRIICSGNITLEGLASIKFTDPLTRFADYTDEYNNEWGENILGDIIDQIDRIVIDYCYDESGNTIVLFGYRFIETARRFLNNEIKLLGFYYKDLDGNVQRRLNNLTVFYRQYRFEHCDFHGVHLASAQ